MRIANFMDSSLRDLDTKGVFSGVGETYNPGNAYELVLHFTPHGQDLAMAPRLADHRIEVIVHSGDGVSLRRCGRALGLVLGQLRRRRIQLVRGRLPYLGSLIGVAAARLLGLPSVVSLGGDNRIVQERNNSYYYGRRWLSYGMEWLTLRLATRIIVPNHFTKDYVAAILGAGLAGRKSVVIPWISAPVAESGPDDGEIMRGLGISDDRVVIPVIGFLNRYKYTDILFDALNAEPPAAAGGRRPLFLFCGDGPLRAEGERRFAGRDHVRFAGWQDRTVIHAVLRRAGLVLVPMSGLVPLEAASLGRPVVASRVEWHPELIEHGVTGLLVDPDDPQDWRRAIARLLDGGSEPAAMAEALRRRYWQTYSPDAVAAEEARLYRTLTARRDAP